MAADLSDPAIVAAIEAISDPVSPVSIIALTYHPTQEKTLSLVSTAFDPWVPHWQETINVHKAEPLFGYGIVAKGRPLREGGEKGVVLVYLPEEVTGVRRARAVVHSRALANKFPDYSAIITISHPSQITEEFVRDQVNYYNQPVPTPTSSPIKPRTPAQMGIGLGLGRPSGSTDESSRAASPSIRGIQPSSSSARSMDRPLPAPPAQPLDLPDNPRLSTPTPPRSSSPTGQRYASGPVEHQHSRKESLSSRFTKALPSFTKSHKDKPEQGSGGDSPKSPSRFDALTSGFGRGDNRRDGEQQHSPRMASGDGRFGHGREAEAVHSAHGQTAPSEQAGDGVDNGGSILSGSVQQPLASGPHSRGVHFESSDPTPASSSEWQVPDANAIQGPPRLQSLPEVTQAPPTGSMAAESLPPPPPPKALPTVPSPQGAGSTSPVAPTLNRLHTLGAIIPYSETESSSQHLHPNPTAAAVDPRSAAVGVTFPSSPTGAAALSTARAKQLDAETRMHDEFRRTEEERTRIRVNSGNRNAGIVRTPTPMQRREEGEDDDEEGLPYDRPDKDEMAEETRGSGGYAQDSSRYSGPPPDYHHQSHHANSAGAHEMPVPTVLVGEASRPLPAPPQNDASLEERHAEARNADEQRARAATEEQERAAAEADYNRREQEARRAALEADEREREERRQFDLLRAREKEERERREREAEDERLRAEEEEARRIKIEQERAAVAVQEAEAEQAKERARIQAEAEAQAEAMQAERERVRRVSDNREKLVKGKTGGGVMLTGHVTVQTTKSVTWRRRHFQLFPTELRLFKSDADTTPIQIISLAAGTKVSQTYEESQVQGSFKILSAGNDGTGEDFFLFSDSVEDKEILLEGLNIALGQ